jgi:lysophospholipase L1-like esterase
MNSKWKILLASSIIVVLVALSLVILHSNYVSSSSPDGKLARVACLGDSITQETGYPTDLQALLGNSSIVGNFGATGATVNINSDIPYYYEPAFRRVKSFAPTTVIIMLGTNDAHDNTYELIDNFVGNYTNILTRIENYSSKPQIYVVIPPPVFNNTLGVNGTAYVEGVIPRIQQVAAQLDLPTIDVYTPLLNHPEYFPDGLHPNGDGAKVIADTIYKAINP